MLFVPRLALLRSLSKLHASPYQEAHRARPASPRKLIQSTSRMPSPVTGSQSDHIVCLVTTPSEEVSRKLTNVLLEQRLAACVNIVPGMTSCYIWEGKIQQDTEQLLVIKSAVHLRDSIQKVVEENHPYDLPEFISLPITGGSVGYLDWITQSTSRAGQSKVG